MRQNVWEVRFSWPYVAKNLWQMSLYYRQVAQGSLGWLPWGSKDVSLMDLMYQNQALGPGWGSGVLLLNWPNKPDHVCMYAATDPPYGSVITALNRCLGLGKFNLGPIQKIFWKHKPVLNCLTPLHTSIHTHKEHGFLCYGFSIISTQHILCLSTVCACSFPNKCKKHILGVVGLFLLLHFLLLLLFFFSFLAIWVSTISDRIHLN